MNKEAVLLPLSGKSPPSGWLLDEGRADGARWVNTKLRISVIGSVAQELDGQTWAHVSIASPDRMPSYEDLVYLKRHWLGDDRKAIMVLPAKAEHVNIHGFALHLFCCLDEDPLPDFTHGSGSI